jgi:hypothetical protein
MAMGTKIGTVTEPVGLIEHSRLDIKILENRTLEQFEISKKIIIYSLFCSMIESERQYPQLNTLRSPAGSGIVVHPLSTTTGITLRLMCQLLSYMISIGISLFYFTRFACIHHQILIFCIRWTQIILTLLNTAILSKLPSTNPAEFIQCTYVSF